ncbi:hypothetical protein NP493_360g02025 [Ridgeia piscesae]|uniref:Calpain catalytic domain-containing protein n=1 Tax=Ridgeia piscesae TaxID=27915 RepID=A0AAD9L4H5_RIDPI|nr:hypothetical protein NP493_360g02025 [Ridgeia piscesae]
MEASAGHLRQSALLRGWSGRSDFVQGRIGNCWFVAACSCLAGRRDIINKVIPDASAQDWDLGHKDKYAGIFHFQLWRYGCWVDVVVDDFLPTKRGHLVFVHSTAPNEFWGALLEKAYAKACGSYQAMEGGTGGEALEDFTGGVSEVVSASVYGYQDTEGKQNSFFRMVLHAYQSGSLMVTGIPVKSAAECVAMECGLVKGHWYAVTAVKCISRLESSNSAIPPNLYMIRLRNPVGRGEWKGKFSDGCAEWTRVTKNEQVKMELVFKDDGEFWMPWEDFCANFTSTAICYIVNTSFFSLTKKYHCESMFRGEWEPPDRAGGSMTCSDQYLNNPQYKFRVTSPEEEIVLSVIHRNQDSRPKVGLSVGIMIIQVEENRRYRLHSPQEPDHTIRVSRYLRFRSSMRPMLKRGVYVAIPSTFRPGQTGSFLLRMFTRSCSDVCELSDFGTNTNKSSVLCRCMPFFSAPILVTRVEVMQLKGVDKDRRDTFCELACDGEKIKVPLSNHSKSNEVVGAIFYRRHPTIDSIKIRVSRVVERLPQVYTDVGRQERVPTIAKRRTLQ